MFLKRLCLENCGDVEYNEEEFLNLGASFETIPENAKGLDEKSELHIIDVKKEEVEEEQEVQTQQSDGIDQEKVKNEAQDDIRIENIELEAKLVAKRIRELIMQGYMVQTKNGYRKITYHDMVILLRAVSGASDVFERELMKQQIPVFSDCGGSYLESSEIATIMSILKVIDNPDQDIELVAVLRSAIGNFTDNELVQIRLMDKTSSFYTALEKAQKHPDETLSKKVKQFIDMLDELSKQQEYMSLDELIWHMYHRTGYYDYVSLLPNGTQKIANLKLLFEKAKDYEKASFKGLYDFIRFIEKLQKSNQDLGAAKIIGENDDVVRIMSIHKSKGLEFPVVFLCNMGKNFNLRELTDPIVLHQEMGFGPKMIDPKKKLEYNTLAKEAISTRARNESISEEMRVLYVALTRAKEKLIMVGTKKDIYRDIQIKQEQLEVCQMENKLPVGMIKAKRSYLDWVLFTVLARKEKMNKELELIIHPMEELTKETLEQEETKEMVWDTAVAISKETIQKLKWEYAYSQASKIPSKTSVTEIKQHDKPENLVTPKVTLSMPKFLAKTTALSGAEKGTIMHKVLQTLELKTQYTKEMLKEHIAKLVSNHMLTEEEADAVKIDSLYTFTQSELAKQIRNATEIEQEKPFYIAIPASKLYEYTGNEDILVQGIIDLYFRDEAGKIVLVDYKTDYVQNEQELVHKYHKQIELYQEALERALGEKVDRCYIYSLYLGKNIPMRTFSAGI